ncbi:class I SAM-dependent methyltransferase [Morganella psychrotolerans]|uniref:Class I SAM-dependent methyltransferase n=1 Tax=Morganella psychrotolerans TaxID=368603 RepID=A0A1B8H470_9GAMM|nr:hypothetical protein [Morganella psychrotolerans]OBU03855.1 hypothetical protein AYY17_09870 [Morganella psychrotolerans]
MSGFSFAYGYGEEEHLGGNALEGDPNTFSPTVWDYLIKRFALRSVLDIGSGLGFAADYFHRAGMQTLAVEGLVSNVDNSLYPALKVDLTHSSVHCRVDLVHCQEVVEHIDEMYLDHLLNSFACGRVLVMTHAFPGQGGHHHVNEQPPEYWIEQLKRYNFELLSEDTRRIRIMAEKEGAIYMANSGMVFINRNRL